MDPEMLGVFDRADELARDLVEEYGACAQTGQVSERAKNLFHEVLVKIRSALDIAMNRLFDKLTSVADSKRAKRKRGVSFPICESETKFDEALERWGLQHLQQVEPALYGKLRQPQPFSTKRQDLLWVRELSNLGKHVGLALQDCQRKGAKCLTMPNGAVVCFTEGVTFNAPDGTPIDPSQLGPVEHTTMASIEVRHGDIKVWEPAIMCRCYCQDFRSYVEELLRLF